MSRKERVIEKLNELILDFEISSNIMNYAIIFDKRIVMAPNTTQLTKQLVEDILNKLDIEKFERLFEKGNLNLVQLNFEKEIIYYLRCTPKVRIIATPQKKISIQAEENLLNFATHVKKVIELLSQPTRNEIEKEIDQSLATLDNLIETFKIPQFESFKKLVKVATNLSEKK